MVKKHRDHCSSMKRAKQRQLTARRRMLFESLERRVVMNADWQNPRSSVDVNNDGFVSPVDALLVINELSRAGSANGLVGKPLPARLGAREFSPYFDTSGDSSITPLDALLVVNHLIRNSKQPSNSPTSSPAMSAEVRVNASVLGEQRVWDETNAVVTLGDGGFVVAYSGKGTGDNDGVFARRFAADGSPVGQEIAVNTYKAGKQNRPAIAANASGDFVIVWNGKGSDDTNGVFFQRFRADGTRLGTEQMANVTTLGDQASPNVGIAQDGSFIITWEGKGPGDNNGIFYRRFQANGSANGSELRVNSTTSGEQRQPQLAVGPDGRFSIAWYGKGNNDQDGVFVKRYDNSANSIGSETLVNQTTSGNQYSPAIAMNDSGQIVVAWVGKGIGDNAGVFFRVLNPDGSFAGPETRANTTIKHKQMSPAVTLAPDNSFVVVWGSMQNSHDDDDDDDDYSHRDSYGDDDDDDDDGDGSSDIVMQRFSSQQSKIGGEITVNSTREGKQENPSVSVNPNSQFTVVWSGKGVGDSDGVFAKQFNTGLQPNSPPVITTVPRQSVFERSSFSFPISAVDANLPNDALTFALDVGPSGASIDPNTGLISWSPSEEQGPGEFAFVVRVVDRQLAFDTETFTVSVTEVNDPPVLEQINDVEALVGSETTFGARATDTDLPSNQLIYSLGAGSPSGAIIDPETGVFRWTPGPEHANASIAFTIVVTDSGSPSLSDSQVVNISVQECNFPEGLNGWTTLERGGSVLGRGTVITQNCVATISEGDSFITGMKRSFVVPNAPAALQFELIDPIFDLTNTDSIKDALEIAIVDVQGKLLVHSYTSSREAAYNQSEGLPPVSGTEVNVNGLEVTVDLSSVPSGTEAIAMIRLINNDADQATHVSVSNVQFVNSSPNPVSTASPSLFSQSASSIDFSRLSNVTASMGVQYGRTSYHALDQVLFADLAIQNDGNYLVDAPFLVAIRNLSDPSVRVSNADGVTLDGDPYFDFSALVTDGTLSPQEVSGSTSIGFYNPGENQFTYDIEVLGVLNHSPSITSDPDLEALIGKPYSYDVDATDLDGDSISYSLQSGPVGMSIDAGTGILTWTPANTERGSHAILVDASDNRGGRAEQQFTLSAIVPPPNRPPHFTSIPVVGAAAAARYSYDSNGLDPDGDPLSFSLATTTVAIPIANPSFEAQVLEEDVFTIGSLTDWTLTGGNFAGAWNPGPTRYPGGLAPDGQNIAYSNDAAISQLLSESLRANTRYVLTVAVGDRLDNAFTAFLIQLRAGGQVLASTANPLPLNGTFRDVSVVFDTPSVHPMLGQPLEIRLSGGTGVNWDNVRLTATEIFVPPQGMTLDALTGELAWSPTVEQIGEHEIRITASDGRGGTATQAYKIQVAPDPLNHSPIIISEPVPSILIQPIPANRSRLSIDFEGIPATPSFLEGSTVPPEAMLSDRFFLTTHGVIFRSENVPTVAVVNLGVGHATSGRNGIGGMRSATVIGYATPIIADFFVPGNLSIPALTDFVSVKVDRQGALGTVVLQGFGLDGVLLQSTSAVDNGSAVLTLSTPGIHRVVIRGTSSTAFDDFSFNEGYPAQIYEYQVRSMDPDSDALTYTLTSAPVGMSIDGTGLIKWPVASLNVGTPSVTVRVDDGRHGFDSQTFVVSPTTNAAKISGKVFNDLDEDGVLDEGENGLAGRTVYLDQSRNYRRDPGERFFLTDANGDYTFDGLSQGNYTIREEPHSGSRLTSPTAGANEVNLVDGQDLAGQNFGNIGSVTANVKPIFTSTPPVDARVDREFKYHATASDADLDASLFDVLVGPEGMIVDSTTGVVVWIPAADQVGLHDVILRVSDGRGGVSLQSFTVKATATQTAPIFTTPPPQAPTFVGQSYDYQFRAQDAENDPLSFSLQQSSTGMSVDSVSGLFSWMPQTGQLGDHTVTITVSDPHGGQDSMTFTIHVVTAAVNVPPVITSTARTQIQLGARYLYAVEVVDENNDRVNLTLPIAPAGMVLDPVTRSIQWVPSPDQFGENRVEIRAEDGHGGGEVQSYVVNVSTSAANETPQIVSLPVVVGTLDSPYAYDLKALDLDGDPLIWSLTTAPRGMSINALSGAVRWTPASDQVGLADVAVLVTDAQGGTATQSFTVTVRAGNVPPVISTVPPTLASVGQIYNYSVRASDVDGDPLKYSFTRAPQGMTINTVTGLVQWTPLTRQVGLQDVEIVVEDGQSGKATQTFRIEVVAVPINRPPVITTMPVLVAAVDLPYSYDVDARDADGNSLTFELVTAPAGMSINSLSGAINWSPNASQVGSHRVTLVVSDGASLALQSYLLPVDTTNRPPVINSVPLQSIIPGQDYRYDVLASDPDGDVLTYRLVTAPTGMEIDSLGRVSWSTSIADAGTHSIVVAVTDPFGSSVSQSYELTVTDDTQAPNIFLDLDSPVAIATDGVIFVSATDNVGVDTLVLELGGVPVPLDASGRGQFNLDQVGTFEVVATATDAAGNTRVVSSSLLVIDNRDANAPEVTITSPSDETVITRTVDVVGSVNDDNLLFYTLEVAVLGSDSFTEIARRNAVVTDGVLGTLDPTMLQNDTYILRLTATDIAGNTATSEQIIHIAGDLKLGNFNLSFTDLTIPVFGVPITVGRTYDTLNAAQASDFGFGWRLEFRDMDLRTSVTPNRLEEYGIFNPFKFGSRVYLTLPGGARQGFTFRPTLAAGFRGTFLGIFEPRFVPDAGVKNSLTVAPADLRIKADGSVYDYATGTAYNPSSNLFGGFYLLTTDDGIAFNVNGETGQLDLLSDPNGNTLTFLEGGVVGPEGRGIAIDRDPRGRIIAITDLNGEKLQYKYDAEGNLASFVDRMNNVTEFKYKNNPAHYLEQVIDPLGRSGVRTEYDAQGRLVGLLDAIGNPIRFSYDPHNLVSSITNQLGHTVTEEYDSRGNTVTHVDALGGITRRTFDIGSNLLSQEDPLGRVTTYAYNERGDALTQTDPLGNSWFSTYQAFTYGTTAEAAVRGLAAPPFTRVRTATDPLGNTTQLDYDNRGNLLTRRDALGYVSHMEYDEFGNNTRLLDPLGNAFQIEYAEGARTSTIDANGNLLSQQQATGSRWDLQYNANGRPTNLGITGMARTAQYDAVNQISVLTDATGRSTHLQYDALGRMTEVQFSDRTIAGSRTYDALGNLTSSADSLGNATRFSYDAKNQLTRTTYADGSFEIMVYNLAGELVTTTNTLGNSTHYVYDDAGRQIQTIDALGGIMSTQYDAAGRMLSTTDPLGHVTRFEYDANGQQTAVVSADGSRMRYVHDASGRQIQTIDASGSITSRSYDGADNLIAVTDALGSTTRYQYGQANELVATVDAQGHVTRYEYDQQGHVTQTTRPDNSIERTLYDSFGRKRSTIDANGQETLYAYDQLGRLSMLTFPDGTQRTRTYMPDGLLSTVTDTHGTMRYEYEPLTRRLSRVSQPDGATVSYTYDSEGNRKSITVSQGVQSNTTRFAYDQLNRVTTVVDSDLGETRYSYDAAGNLTRTEFPNGVVETRSYDSLNRLLFVEARSATAIVSSQRYTLTATGMRSSVVQEGGRRVDYTYDPLLRLTREAITDTVFGDRTFEYMYDAVGNRLSLDDSLTGHITYSYDVNDRLVAESSLGKQVTYTYDQNGNTLSSQSATDQVFYNWDFENRLISADTDGDGTIEVLNKYNAQGIRIAQVVNGQETHFVIDVIATYPQVLLEYLTDGSVVASYVYGHDLVSQARNAQRVYYHADGLGSTSALTDADGHVVSSYAYDAFGRTLNQTENFANSYLFAGEQRDAALSLDYLRARYYNPSNGRFLSADTFPSTPDQPLSMNRYLYAYANPTNYTDPSGYFTLIELDMANAINAKNKIENAISQKKHFDAAVNAGFRALQGIGMFMSIAAEIEGVTDLAKFGQFFEGGLQDEYASTGIAGLTLYNLGTSIYSMLTTKTDYVFHFGAPPPSIPDAMAWVFAKTNPTTIFYNEHLLKKPPFPTPERPLGQSIATTTIHEFMHLSSKGNIDDVDYGIKAMFLSPLQAVDNADNYRLAVQALLAFLDATDARNPKYY
jgi:RHS repeat-associated protein